MQIVIFYENWKTAAFLFFKMVLILKQYLLNKLFAFFYSLEICLRDGKHAEEMTKLRYQLKIQNNLNLTLPIQSMV